MVILYSEEFVENLENILDFIAKDSLTRANEFAKDLKKKIENISFMPYRFTKNSTIDNEKVRNMIYKGYVVVFEIGEEHIEILAIYKHNLWQIKD